MAKKQGKNVTHLKDLQSDKENARKHNPRNVGMISEALQEVGAARSIVIDEDNRVLAGNATIEAAAQAGIEKVRVIEAAGDEIIAVRRSNLTNRQKTRLALYDNQTADLAEWDDDVLKKMFEKDAKIFNKIFRDNELKGFGIDEEPVDVEPQIDKAEELNKVWKVKTGDLWRIGEHRLLCGDSTKREDVERVMGGEKAVFCFTSPPYSDQRDYQGDIDLSPGNLAKFLSAPCELFAVNLGISRKDNEINQYWDEYISFAKSVGLKFLSWNIWDKGEAGAIGAQTAMFAINHEWIFVFGEKKKLNRTVKCKHAGEKEHGSMREKDGTLTRNIDRKTIGDYKQISTVTTISAQKARNLEVDHPAMYPVALPQEYISACTDPGDIIFEPFTGSGTNIVACQNLERKCRGIEISPAYCAVVLQRMQDAFTGIDIERT